MRVIDIASHRNGISGNHFHVVTFDYEGEAALPQRMVGIVFDEPGTVAVLDTDLLANGDIGFGSNSWRGDYFENDLRAAIKTWEAAGRPARDALRQIALSR